MKGIYTLIVSVERRLKVKVGKLGSFWLRRGTYLYTGSALGRGPSSIEGRVKRHLRKRKKMFWHIDYVLKCDSVNVIAAVYSETTAAMECRVNREIERRLKASPPIEGFGSSDCECKSHLLYVGGKMKISELKHALTITYENVKLRPVMQRLT